MPLVPSRVGLAEPSLKEAGRATRDQPGDGWTVVLRRQPTRMAEGRPERGYTDVYEIVCCDCGDDPDLNYSEVAPVLRQVRGPYPIADGITAYVMHLRLRHQPATWHQNGMVTDAG
jgi:hypothetical protein